MKPNFAEIIRKHIRSFYIVVASEEQIKEKK